MSSAGISPRNSITQYLSTYFDRLLDSEPRAAEFSNTAWQIVRLIAKRASQRNWSAYLVGGAIRDLALSGGTRTPRDVDFVFCEATQNELAAEFDDLSSVRKTSFGGLRYQHNDVLIDIWPLKDTFALRERQTVRIQDVPQHAFLDVEAVAVDLSPRSSHSRHIVENGFTQAVLSRTLDVNYIDNPFPEVCIVKAFRTAISLKLAMRRRLVEYVSNRKWDLSALMEAQKLHYGDVMLGKSELEEILGFVAKRSREEGVLDISSVLLQRKEVPVR